MSRDPNPETPIQNSIQNPIQNPNRSIELTAVFERNKDYVKIKANGENEISEFYGSIIRKYHSHQAIKDITIFDHGNTSEILLKLKGVKETGEEKTVLEVKLITAENELLKTLKNEILELKDYNEAYNFVKEKIEQTLKLVNSTIDKVENP